MDVAADTIETYIRLAFAGMARALDQVDDESVNVRPGGWGTNTVAGLIVHCCELAPSWFESPGLGRESIRDRDSEFTTTSTVAELRNRIETAAAKTCTLVREFDLGPTSQAHPLRDFLPGADRTDGALVLHVLEELFQHLGHIEVTIDALAATHRGHQ